MNKDLVNLLRNCPSSAILVNDDEYTELNCVLSMQANLAKKSCFFGKNGPIFKEKLENLSKKQKIVYFVVRNIDTTDFGVQQIFEGIVKDRVCANFVIPQNVIILFTVRDKQNLSKISTTLLHFCTVA